MLAKDLNYKYYCPNCKPKTIPKSPIRTIKSASRQTSQSKPNSPPQSVEAESIKTPLQHSRPPLEDSLVSTEGLKEPQIRKVRLLEEYKVQSTEGSVKQSDSVAETPKDDPVKKKLDMMFNKHQLKKKGLQGKLLISQHETHSAIEKLLGQYGGRKLQLSDLEIRNDLDLFRELSSLNGQVKKGVKREDDLNTVSTVSSLVRESVFTITQSPIPNKNGKVKGKGQRGGFNKFMAEDNDQKGRICHT